MATDESHHDQFPCGEMEPLINIFLISEQAIPQLVVGPLLELSRLPMQSIILIPVYCRLHVHVHDVAATWYLGSRVAVEEGKVNQMLLGVQDSNAFSNFHSSGKHHQSVPHRFASEMKDFEQGYDLHASPKLENVQDGGDKAPSHPSIWLLLAISMPRMAIQMAWAAQWAALGPYLSTMLPRMLSRSRSSSGLLLVCL
ncbi:hypothetical protein GQ600_10525 [Phytophthora cactorum]|nr:hypothetical protein GQ600_10525 [Phytophthora cactorum]